MGRIGGRGHRMWRVRVYACGDLSETWWELV